MAGHQHHGPQDHGHEHVHLGEADWAAMAAHAEQEGELLIGFVREAAAWAEELRGADAPSVRRVIDIGSGPGVGTCELAARFPEAEVVAVDGSAAMLERAQARAARLGVADRVRTHLAELPGGLDDVEPADLVWASMSLHHVGDEVGVLRSFPRLLAPGGLLAIAEVADPMRVLPDDADQGLSARVHAASASWFAAMRADLPGAVPSDEVAAMVAAAGFSVVGARVSRLRLDAPLAPDARAFARDHVRRLQEHHAGVLAADDLAALAALEGADDLIIEASRQLVVGRVGEPG